MHIVLIQSLLCSYNHCGQLDLIILKVLLYCFPIQYVLRKVREFYKVYHIWKGNKSSCNIFARMYDLDPRSLDLNQTMNFSGWAYVSSFHLSYTILYCVGRELWRWRRNKKFKRFIKCNLLFVFFVEIDLLWICDLHWTLWFVYVISCLSPRKGHKVANIIIFSSFLSPLQPCEVD